MGDFNSDGHLDAFCITDTSDGQVILQSPLSRLAIISPTLTFAPQNVGTTSVPQVATVTNVGWSALPIGKINITGTNAGSFTQTNTCGTSLAANATCTISVSFAPRKAGNLKATVILAYSGLGSPLTLSLSGTGVTAVTATLTPPTLRYPTQLVGTSSATQTATLTNTGNQDVAVSNIAISGAFTETNNCPSTLALAGTCQIKVIFSPAAKGNATGTLTVTDNASTSPPNRIAKRQRGTVMSLSPIGVNFSDQKVGTIQRGRPRHPHEHRNNRSLRSGAHQLHRDQPRRFLANQQLWQRVSPQRRAAPSTRNLRSRRNRRPLRLSKRRLRQRRRKPADHLELSAEPEPSRLQPPCPIDVDLESRSGPTMKTKIPADSTARSSATPAIDAWMKAACRRIGSHRSISGSEVMRKCGDEVLNELPCMTAVR